MPHVIDRSVILFLVTDGEVNMFDQKHLEYSVRKAANYRVQVIRRTVQDLTARASLTEHKRLIMYALLFIKGHVIH